MPQFNSNSSNAHLQAQFFSVNEAVIVLGVSRKSVQTWIDSGLLPAYRLGLNEQVVRIRCYDLEQFIKEHSDLVANARV